MSCDAFQTEAKGKGPQTRSGFGFQKAKGPIFVNYRRVKAEISGAQEAMPFRTIQMFILFHLSGIKIHLQIEKN